MSHADEPDIPIDIFNLPVEDDTGNQEYKCHLLNLSEQRIEHYACQMKYRLEEGYGEAIYDIGVKDNGEPLGLVREQLDESLENLRLIADKINAQICDLQIQEVPTKNGNAKKTKKSNTKTKRPQTDEEIAEVAHASDGPQTLYVAEALIRERNVTGNYVDLRIAVAGSVDSAKSSTIGVLIKGKLDDGRGTARLNVFNHRHEITSGRTSSISQQILGFDDKGEVVNSQYEVRSPTWQEIVKRSTKVITFFDLAGHQKYLKTTVRGLSSHHPDYCLIMVGSNMGITQITKEHIILCLSLNIPIIVVMSKIDIAPEHILKNTYDNICRLLKLPGVEKLPYMVKSIDDAILCSKRLAGDHIVPIFQISNVSGFNLDLLKRFLNYLPARARTTYLKNRDQPIRYQIHETFLVKGVGTVVSGLLTHGTVKIGSKLKLGPDNRGLYQPCMVRSIHCKRVPLLEASSGYHICLNLKKIPRNEIRRGMVLLDHILPDQVVRTFETELTILHSHSTTIQRGYQPVISINNIRQSAEIVDFHVMSESQRPSFSQATSQNDGSDEAKKTLNADPAQISKKDRKSRRKNLDSLKIGDRAQVIFRFVFQGESVELGDKLLFREGKTKGVGYVTKLIK